MNEVLLLLYDLLQDVGFLSVFVVLYSLSMFIFWRESRLVRKNNNSIFDQWFLSTILMAVWGRISYMIANWSQFSQLSWFYIPYERYGSQVYLFRLLPWKIFAVWDGGFLFTGLVASFMVFNFLYVRYVKKWSWQEMMRPVLLTSHFFLGSILVVYGVLIKNEDVVVYGVVLLVLVILLYLLKYLHTMLPRRVVISAEVVYILVSDLFIAYVFLAGDVSQIDQFNVVVLLITTVLLAGVYYRDSLHPKVVISSYSKVHPLVVVEPNKAIRPRKKWDSIRVKK